MNFKKMLLLLALSLLANRFLLAEERVVAAASKVEAQDERAKLEQEDGDEGTWESPENCILKLKALCAKKIKTKCLDTHKANVRELTAHKAATEDLTAKSLCVDKLAVNDKADIKQLALYDLNSKDICCSGTARLNEVCQKYKALVEYCADSSYTLGDYLAFDTIVDDPNNNISLSPTIYTVPVSGYYVVTLKLDQKCLVTCDTLLGVPVAVLEIDVNKTKKQKIYTPFLTFNNDQKSVFTALFRFKAGDKLETKYKIFYVNHTGTSEVNGTITIEGGHDNSFFSIHYLSSDCCKSDPCEKPCLPCENPCKPESCHVPCKPCNDKR